jgi:hypothetical protein
LKCVKKKKSQSSFPIGRKRGEFAYEPLDPIGHLLFGTPNAEALLRFVSPGQARVFSKSEKPNQKAGQPRKLSGLTG